jgi:hypothetical protein
LRRELKPQRPGNFSIAEAAAERRLANAAAGDP